MAGGATVSVAMFDIYCEALQQEIKKQPFKELVPQSFYDAEASFSELSLELAEELSLLSPFGNENPSPVFLTRGIVPVLGKCRAVGKMKNHLQMVLEEGTEQLKAIAFGYGGTVSPLPKKINALYKPQVNAFNGQRSLQLTIEELWPASVTAKQEAEETVLPVLMDLLNWKTACDPLPFRNRELQESRESAFAQLGAIAASGERGHLLVARNEATAVDAVSHFDRNAFRQVQGESDQCLSLSTILLYPYANFKENCFPETGKHWHHIWLLNGEWIQGEAAIWAQHHPQATIHVLPCDEPFQQPLFIENAENLQSYTSAALRVTVAKEE